MDEIPFGTDGYTLVRACDDDREYILNCLKETILSSVTDEEKNLSGLWIEDIVKIGSFNLDNGVMENEAFKLKKGDRDAGMLWMGKSKDQFTCDDTGYLLGLFVEKPMRGRGLGRSLLDAAEIWCKSKGLVTMTINAGADNKVALELYDSAGYVPQSIVMRRTLL